MQKQQNTRRSFALIAAMLLCMVTMIVPVSADSYDLTYPTSDPVRCLYHLQITTSAEGSFFLGPLFPETDDPDAEWGITRLQNAVLKFSRSVPDMGIVSEYYSCEWFQIGSWYDGDAESQVTISVCSYDVPGPVAVISYDPYGVTSIYNDLAGTEFDTLDIYVRPSYDYAVLPEIVSPTAEEIETYSLLSQWGFSSAINAYPKRSEGSEAPDDGSFSDGWDQGWNDGYTQGYDLGHYDGFREGQTDALNGNETLKDLIFAIFGAPIELINGMLDFDLFGINVASLVKTLLTLSITALILWAILKLVKG